VSQIKIANHLSACALAAIAMVLVMSGCQTSSVDDLAPSAVANADGPINTGEYPTFGRIPEGETAQLGPDGTAALRGKLTAARASQNIGAAAPETYAEKMRRLRKLGQVHGNQTLEAIEGN
jgi:hypothetical protein